MLKIKSGALFTAILAMAMVFSLAFFAIAKVQAQNQEQNQTQNETQNQAQNQGEVQQLQEQNQEQNQEQEGEPNLIATPTQAKRQTQDKGQTNAQQHRSVVANFVQSLLKVASSTATGTAGGIGEQVRLVAQQQNQSASTTIQAMEKVQTRNKVRTFLFGSDYKNLGALRSEIVHTRNRVEQLNRIMADIENEGDRTELQNQIQTLEQEQLRVENFIKTEESKFSLFGWLIKLFNR